MKSRRTKATEISQSVKKKVFFRDKERCIFCGSPYAAPEAHVISRAQNGMGCEQNIITVCRICHERMDQSLLRPVYTAKAIEYLKGFYPDWAKEMVTYKKY